MLNSVAIYVCSYLVNSNGPLATDDFRVLGGSDAVPDGFMFAQIVPRSNLSTALIYSAAIAFLCWYVMKKNDHRAGDESHGEITSGLLFADFPKIRS